MIDDLVGRVDRKRRRDDLGPLPQPAGSDTVYFAIVDESGMAVSFINSLYDDFGSGIVTPRPGWCCTTAARASCSTPATPTASPRASGRMHTLVPAMVLKDGEPHMAFGVMGAHFQPMGHVYVMTNMFHYGMDPQEAIDTPRVFFEGDTVLVEEAVPAGGGGRAQGARPSRWRPGACPGAAPRPF